MVWTPYGPGDISFWLIDNWNCSCCEQEASAGATHPPLSAVLSRGGRFCWMWLICYILYAKFSILITHSFSYLHSLHVCMSGHCALPLLRAEARLGLSCLFCTLGGPLFRSVKTPPPPGWNTEHRISCQPASPELPGRSLGDREDCEKSALVSQLSSSSPQLWLTQNGCALS